ncbi:MAG TPA: rhodanese-like domain-containing protein [Phototrophicaceae bacterium]|nr:rhodanese-like domain-containing protein [Phototrophicaceae bacterium]
MSKKTAKSKPGVQAVGNQNRLVMMGVVAVVLVVAVVILLLLNRAPTATTTDAGMPAEVSVAEAVSLRDAGAFVLDVRRQDEWDEFHLANSTLIPLDELTNRLAELPRDEKILVVCRSGNRSGQARTLLLEAGFTQVTSMAGGLTEWRALGYAVES